MTAVAPLPQVQDVWDPISVEPTTRRKVPETGAEFRSTDFQSRDLWRDLLPTLWPSLTHLELSVERLRELTVRIQAVLTEHWAEAPPFWLESLLAPRTGYELWLDIAARDRPKAVSSASASEAVHSRLARELREMTGLAAATLAAGFGVTREQYQRWLAGSAISGARHGQLTYLHTIATDVSRRLGLPAAKVWWKTPTKAGTTPGELVKRRRTDLVYAMVASLPDRQPLVDGMLAGIPVRLEPAEGDEDSNDAADTDAWSPYGGSRS
jgi:hypothetical protein